MNRKYVKSILALLFGVLLIPVFVLLVESFFYGLSKYEKSNFFKSEKSTQQSSDEVATAVPASAVPDYQSILKEGQEMYNALEFATDTYTEYREVIKGIPDEFLNFRKYDMIGRWSLDIKYQKTDLSHIHPGYSKMQATAVIIQTGEVLFDKEYITDSGGFRMYSAPENRTEKDNFVIVMGCSFVFGSGIDYEHTLPHLLQQGLQKSNVYSYGIGGGAINTIITGLNPTMDNFSRVREDKGVLVYRFIEDHLERVICGSACHSTHDWRLDLPSIEVRNGVLYEHGTHRNRHRIRDYLSVYLNNSPTLKYFGKKIRVPFTRSELHQFVMQLDYARNMLSQEYGKNIEKSYFVFNDSLTNSREMKILTELLLQNGFIVIDEYMNIDRMKLTRNSDKIPIDYHPTEVSNQLMSYTIRKRLKADFGDERF